MMKKVSEWDIDYILNLPQGEHDWIEFKGSQLLDFNLPGVNPNDVQNELSKQISAFANSGGGTIVYGIQDTAIGTPRNVDANGGVSLNLKNDTKEWLEDIIPKLVDFEINSFNVYVLTSNDASAGVLVGKGLFLIEIPSSEAAPHQAFDKKYYARVGGKSRPIGHRLLMDIVGRAKYPLIEMSCQFVPKEARPKRDQYRNKDAIQFFCQNIGKIFANYVSGFLYIPTEICWGYDDDVMEIESKEYVRKSFDNIQKDVVGFHNVGIEYGGSRALTISRHDPVLPKLGFAATTIDLDVERGELHTNLSQERIFWEIYADNSPMHKGNFKIADLFS